MQDEHADRKVKRETGVEGKEEGCAERVGETGEMKEKKKKKEDSPGNLRYETLIKIISSASVECQDAYTTASRECNDLNGNNSVKDGCSCARVRAAALLPMLRIVRSLFLSPCSIRSPAFRSARTGIRRLRDNTMWRVVHESDIVIWLRKKIPLPQMVTII